MKQFSNISLGFEKKRQQKTRQTSKKSEKDHPFSTKNIESFEMVSELNECN